MRDREKYMQREIGIKTRIKGDVHTHTQIVHTSHTIIHTQIKTHKHKILKMKRDIGEGRMEGNGRRKGKGDGEGRERVSPTQTMGSVNHRITDNMMRGGVGEGVWEGQNLGEWGQRQCKGAGSRERERGGAGLYIFKYSNILFDNLYI